MRSILKAHLRHTLWALPFLSFLIGYVVFSYAYDTHSVDTPSIVGQQLAPALKVLSEQKLNIRLIKETEDPNLPENTILLQIPRPGQRIKPHQTVNCIISKNSTVLAPNLVNSSEDAVATTLDRHCLRTKSYLVPSKAPLHRCIGQIPAADYPVTDHKVITYFADPTSKPVIMPNICGHHLTDVLEFFGSYDLHPIITHRAGEDPHHRCTACVVTSQKPLAGSLIDLKKSPSIHLHSGHAF